jgi:hypothetical protein
LKQHPLTELGKVGKVGKELTTLNISATIKTTISKIILLHNPTTNNIPIRKSNKKNHHEQ